MKFIGLIWAIVISITSLCWFINAKSINKEGPSTTPSVPVPTTEQIFKDCQYNLTDLSRLILGLDDGLDFYQEHITDLVLDAAIGTRILEAQLSLVLNQSSPSVTIPKSLRRALNMIFAKSQVLSEHIIVSEVENPEISQSTKNDDLPWIISADLWKSPTVWNDKAFSFIATEKRKNKFANNGEILSETVSDACIAELFNGCGLSSDCATSFLQKPLSKYSLTHQVIYALVGEKSSCLKKDEFRTMSEKVNGGTFSWQDFRSKLCDKVWVEANIIEEMSFPIQFRDLFTEQVAICSLAGYKSFLRPEWLDRILSWQIADENSQWNGCFGLQNLTTTSEVSVKRRRKREDVLLKTGAVGNEQCSVHFTAVGLASMGLYLRQFLESCIA